MCGDDDKLVVFDGPLDDLCASLYAYAYVYVDCDDAYAYIVVMVPDDIPLCFICLSHHIYLLICAVI